MERALHMRRGHLTCSTWRRIREEELADLRGDIKRILNTNLGATAAIHMILRTGILEQFKAVPCEKQERSRVEAREETNRARVGTF